MSKKTTPPAPAAPVEPAPAATPAPAPSAETVDPIALLRAQVAQELQQAKEQVGRWMQNVRIKEAQLAAFTPPAPPPPNRAQRRRAAKG